MNTSLVKQEQQLTPQNFSLDHHLHCYELHWNYNGNDDNDNDNDNDNDDNNFNCFEEEEDDNDYINSLLCKEKTTQISENVLESNKFFLEEVRREILEWMKRVSLHHNLSLNTLILAINYFDRFILSVGFEREKSWVPQLVGVSCLSLASKFEEIHVPLLCQLQMDCKCIFEAKTIKRMELFILSTLEWNMNAVTPLSYFGHLLNIFKLKNHLHNWEISTKFESLILSAVVDLKYLYYAPSVVATATMLQTLKELRLLNTTQHQIHLIIDTFELKKEKVEECQIFIKEMSTKNDRTNNKRRRCCFSGDTSPTRVLDIGISQASKQSTSSWPPLRPSPDHHQHVPKKCRTSSEDLFIFYCA